VDPQGVTLETYETYNDWFKRLVVTAFYREVNKREGANAAEDTPRQLGLVMLVLDTKVFLGA